MGGTLIYWVSPSSSLPAASLLPILWLPCHAFPFLEAKLASVSQSGRPVSTAAGTNHPPKYDPSVLMLDQRGRWIGRLGRSRSPSGWSEGAFTGRETTAVFGLVRDNTRTRPPMVHAFGQTHTHIARARARERERESIGIAWHCAASGDHGPLCRCAWHSLLPTEGGDRERPTRFVFSPPSGCCWACRADQAGKAGLGSRRKRGFKLGGKDWGGLTTSGKKSNPSIHAVRGVGMTTLGLRLA